MKKGKPGKNRAKRKRWEEQHDSGLGGGFDPDEVELAPARIASSIGSSGRERGKGGEAEQSKVRRWWSKVKAVLVRVPRRERGSSGEEGQARARA